MKKTIIITAIGMAALTGCSSPDPRIERTETRLGIINEDIEKVDDCVYLTSESIMTLQPQVEDCKYRVDTIALQYGRIGTDWPEMSEENSRGVRMVNINQASLEMKNCHAAIGDILQRDACRKYYRLFIEGARMAGEQARATMGE